MNRVKVRGPVLVIILADMDWHCQHAHDTLLHVLPWIKGKEGSSGHVRIEQTSVCH
jgi:hypothetical protein